MTSPNFGSQPGQGTQPGWIPPQQQQYQAPQMPPQPQQPQNQPFNPQTVVMQPEPHVQMPAPYFPPPQQQQPQQQPVPYQGNQLYPNQQQYAPAWQGGQPMQQQPQQPIQNPMGPPRQPNGQFAPAQNVQFDQQGRMFGPGLPQELQGKTMQDALRLYGMMRQGYLQTQQGQPPQGQQPAQQQPSPTQQGQVQAGARPSSPWTDPEGFFGRLLDEKLGAMLGPVLQQSNEQQIAGVRDEIAQRYPIYAQYETQVIQRLEGLPIETLKNPQAWELALSAVLGEQQLRGGQQQRQLPSQNGNQAVLPWQNPNNGQPSQQWQQMNQPPQHQTFFTESPSAVIQGGMQPGEQQVGQLSAAQLEVARRFGMSPQQYLQGMGIR